jgi:hypothetical protein
MTKDLKDQAEFKVRKLKNVEVQLSMTKNIKAQAELRYWQESSRIPRRSSL